MPATSILIERSAKALNVLRENLRSLEIENEATVLRGSASALLANYPAEIAFQIAFLDPPYEQTNEYADSLLALARSSCVLGIAQHPSRLSLEERYGRLMRTRVLKQGDNSLSFYEPDE